MDITVYHHDTDVCHQTTIVPSMSYDKPHIQTVLSGWQNRLGRPPKRSRRYRTLSLGAKRETNRQPTPRGSNKILTETASRMFQKTMEHEAPNSQDVFVPPSVENSVESNLCKIAFRYFPIPLCLVHC